MLKFSATQESDLPEVLSFLHGVFKTPPDHRLFREDVLHWKAYTPHPLWDGSRSYVFRQDGQIIAHGCATPLVQLSSEGELRTPCIIDWAASPSVPGAGALLFRKIGMLVDGVTAVGGSDDTQAVLPRLGFKVRASMAHFIRVIRPVRDNWSHRAKGLKTPVRIMRDMKESLRGTPAVPAAWSARPVEQFDGSVKSSLPAPGRPSAVICVRTVPLLNYLLSCPAARIQGFTAENKGKVAGYFILSLAGAECRIADLGCSTDRPEDWRAVFALAVETASHMEPVTRIRFSATARHFRELAHQSGFRLLPEEPVFYWSSNRNPAPAGEWSLTLLDNDFFYL
jgi:hypothetical protein